MYIVLCYDVVSNRRRTRLHKALKGFLQPVQKSVFEGEITQRRYAQMLRRVHKEIDLETDTVRLYHLCARCRPATVLLGTSVTVERQMDLLV